MSNLPQFNNPAQANAPLLLNANFIALEHEAVFAMNSSTTLGLNWGYLGGRWGGFAITAATLTLTASSTNYVVVAIATGVTSTSTSTTNWNDATNYVRVYKVTTGPSQPTAIEDHRAGPRGLHGGAGGGGSSVTIDTDGTLAANSDAVVASQKATKTYVDGKVAGLSWKQAARAATTTNGTLATAYANASVIDGVTLATGDRILVKNQTTASENGIYTVNASGAPTRSTDADAGTELVNASVYVSEGTTLADTQWTCTTNAPITPSTTALAFAQLTAGGGGATFLYAMHAWVETTGNDGTAALGNSNLPYATINAALAAINTVSTTTAAVIHIGLGAFAPVDQDGSGTGSSTLNGASKLRSNLWFKGAFKPTLDSFTAPTTLVQGTIIKGPMRIHSTRNNVRFTDLGIDSGSAVCTALYSSAAQEGLFYNNVTQTTSLAPCRGAVVKDVIVLCQSASAGVHAFNVENCIGYDVDGIDAYYGAHGVVIKSAYGTLSRAKSYGHLYEAFLWKDGGATTDVAPCHDNSATNLVGGALVAGDTPYGLQFACGSPNTMKRIAVSGVSLTGISTAELRTVTTGSASPIVAETKIDNAFTDNTTWRTELNTPDLIDQRSVYLNGQPMGWLPTTGLWESGGIVKVNPNYSGPAIRVRRSSDNAEKDIGFIGTNLDSATLLTFAGSGSAYVTTVYGQYNWRHMVQATTTKQPRIVNAGVYDSTIYFDGSAHGMSTANSSSGTNSALTLAVGGLMRSAATTQVLFEHNSADTTNDAVMFVTTGANPFYATMTSSTGSGTRTAQYTEAMATQRVLTAVFDRTQANGVAAAVVYENAAALTAGTSAQAGTFTATFPVAPYFIGARNNASLFTPLNLRAFAIYEVPLGPGQIAAVAGALG